MRNFTEKLYYPFNRLVPGNDKDRLVTWPEFRDGKLIAGNYPSNELLSRALSIFNEFAHRLKARFCSDFWMGYAEEIEASLERSSKVVIPSDIDLESNVPFNISFGESS